MVSAQSTRVSPEEEAQLSPHPVETGSPDSQQPIYDDNYDIIYDEVDWSHEDIDHYYDPCREPQHQVGLHPIVLGDTLGKDDRYKVHRKLGAGGSATVWLCRDQKDEKWVAIKVMSARASQEATHSRYLGEMAIFDYFRDDLKVDNDELVANHVCVPDSYFVQDGPNGQHFCFVLPVLSPVLSGTACRAWYYFYDKPEVLREICAQMAVAMNYLHGKGICHGDFRPANILFYVDGIEDATEDEINAMFPESEKFEIESTTDVKLFPSFPKFIYSSSDQIPRLHPGNIHIMVSDFGEAYYGGHKPDFLGIPLKYAAPEVLFTLDSAFGMATDIWSLGMSILQLRHDEYMFEGFDPLQAVKGLERSLGPLPEPYRSVWFSDRFPFGGGPGKDSSDMALTENVSKVERWTGEYNSKLEKILREPSKSLWAMEKGENLSLRPGQSQVCDLNMKEIKSTIPEEEAQQLLDLLSGIFRYSPDERSTIKQVMDHPWITGRFSTSEDISVDVLVGVPEESMVSEMVDVQLGLTSSRTEPKEEHEVSYDAPGIPAPDPPAQGGVVRMLSRFTTLFFPVTWRLGGSCFGT